ncbi:hypothetical protein AK830_g7263 [Neonectria ditissima]|uniref:Uncharacterized protein n=1 Tax=Neonectria ditissima TaxID=78410 RepID=A0A0P7BFC8_9HYPO|nr:hypothetical protein AK830_g7263 [Neonectria ditissima]
MMDLDASSRPAPSCISGPPASASAGPRTAFEPAKLPLPTDRDGLFLLGYFFRTSFTVQKVPALAQMDSVAHFKVVSQDDYARKIRGARNRTPHTKSVSGCLMYPQYSGGAISSLSAVTIIPSSSGAKNGTSTFYLMQHLHHHWDAILNMPFSQEIISLSKSHSLVRNTILAIAACHLRHVSPGIIHHRIAEHFQQSLALQDYQATLDTPRQELGQSDVNVLLLSAVLLNILALTLPQSETSELSNSWVFSPREDRLGWLALQAGLRPLIVSMAEENLHKTLNFLGKIFLGEEVEVLTAVPLTDSLDEVPKSWIRIFGLDNELDEENNTGYSGVFRFPVAVVALLRALKPNRRNALKNFTFLAKMKPEFRSLLFTRDERALWLFGYWLGLMRRFKGLWWCEQRMTRDYNAILTWLGHLRLTDRPGEEGKMWEEMMKDLELAPVYI